MTGGCFVLIHGIPAVASSHVFTVNAHHVSGSLNSWVCITLIIGVLRLPAAAGVLTGQPAGALVRRGGARAYDLSRDWGRGMPA